MPDVNITVSESLTLTEQIIPIIGSVSLDLQMGVPVKDTKGNSYVYGGVDIGYMERLEHGTSFDGANIVSEFKTGDMAIGQNQNEIEIRKVKHLTIAKSVTAQSVNITHYGDGCLTATTNKNNNASLTILCPVRSTTHRIVKKIHSGAFGDFNFHAFHCVLTTNDEEVAYEPLGIFIKYKQVREELI